MSSPCVIDTCRLIYFKICYYFFLIGISENQYEIWKYKVGMKWWFILFFLVLYTTIKYNLWFNIKVSFRKSTDRSRNFSQTRCVTYTQKTIVPFPFTLNGILSCWQISFQFWTKRIPFGSKSKGKLSPRSYPIQLERKWK